MSEDLVLVEPPDIAHTALAPRAALVLPRLIVDAGPAAVEKFLEFFAARIANRRTRAAYGRAVGQFLAWCEARALLDRIDTGTRVGLRDRALLSVMVYSFARVSAAVGMRRQDYFRQGTRGWLRLHEKGGKRHDVPAHHRAEEAVEAYLAAGVVEDAKAPLFQSVDRAGRLSGRPLARRAVLAMIKRRAAAVGLPATTCCHTFRATGITAYLSNGGTLEHAQQIAGHASPKTTKLYDRTADTITVDEIERIVI